MTGYVSTQIEARVPRRHTELQALIRSWRLVRYLVRTSLRRGNVGTFFGRVWWLLDPFFTMLIYVLLVKVIFKRGGADYPVFVFTGVVGWKFFSSGVLTAISTTVGKQHLMKQIAFPRSAIPLAAVLTETVNFGFGLIVLIIFAIPFGVYPSIDLAYIPLIAAVELLITLGLALMLSAANIFYRDVYHLAGYVFRLWFYLSPALYTPSELPRRFEDIYRLNPFAAIFPAYRDALMQHQAPDLPALGFAALEGAIVLVAGYAVFMRLQRTFPKVL